MRPVAIRRKNWIHLGQQGGWTKGSGYDLDRRNLSTPEHPGPRLPGFRAPWLSRFSDQLSR
jgi:hypothetical protein